MGCCDFTAERGSERGTVQPEEGCVGPAGALIPCTEVAVGGGFNAQLWCRVCRVRNGLTAMQQARRQQGAGVQAPQGRPQLPLPVLHPAVQFQPLPRADLQDALQLCRVAGEPEGEVFIQAGIVKTKLRLPVGICSAAIQLQQAGVGADGEQAVLGRPQPFAGVQREATGLQVHGWRQLAIDGNTAAAHLRIQIPPELGTGFGTGLPPASGTQPQGRQDQHRLVRGGGTLPACDLQPEIALQGSERPRQAQC